MIALGLLVVVLVVAVGVVLWAVGIYNGLVALRNTVDKEFSDIDVLLKQRMDELTKLVDTCKGYMKYEQATFEKITQARSAVAGASTVDQRIAAEGMVTSALRGLFAVAENYPDLKANQNFLHLQGRISDVETQIATRRDEYNNAVNVYNIQIQVFPAMFVARMLGFTARELYKAAEADRQDVKISF
ncbi:MAG: LemA family protein [Terriglobales bacterium]